MAPRVALLTGSTGFIGRHLTQHLERSGWQVHQLVRGRTTGSAATSPRDCSRLHAYDGSYESVHLALAHSRPDAVFHLASRFLAEHRPKDIRDLLESNLLFGAQLAEAMIHVGSTLLVNAGTAWQCFGGMEYRPVNLYAATKQAYEDLLAYYADAHGLRVITLLLFDTYGPADNRGKLLSALLDTAQRSEPLKLSPGDQLLDLVHVSDVCRAFVRAYEVIAETMPSARLRFAVDSDTRLSLKALVAVVQEVVGRPLAVQFGARPYRNREVMLPASNLRRLPGWAPRVALTDGLRELVDEMAAGRNV